MTLSDDLTKLAARAKGAEDRFAAAQKAAHDKVEHDVEGAAQSRSRRARTSCARPPRRTKEMSRRGGATYRRAGMNRSPRFVAMSNNGWRSPQSGSCASAWVGTEHADRRTHHRVSPARRSLDGRRSS